MDYANATMLLVAIAIFGTLIYGPLQNICIDWSRNAIFESRDEIYDLALAGRLEFTSEAYLEIRQSLNSLIRFAHRISWPWLVAMLLAVPMSVFQEKPSVHQALSKIEDTEVRFLIEKKLHKARKAVVILLFVRSPVLWIFLATAILGRRINSGFDSVARRIADSIQNEAETYDENEGGSRRRIRA